MRTGCAMPQMSQPNPRSVPQYTWLILIAAPLPDQGHGGLDGKPAPGPGRNVQRVTSAVAAYVCPVGNALIKLGALAGCRAHTAGYGWPGAGTRDQR